MKKYFFLILILQLQLQAQPRFQSDFNAVFSEFHVVRSETGVYQAYLIFKVPFNALVFYKSDSTFKAGLKVGIEVSDENSVPVFRNYSEKSVFVDDFNLTNSRTDYLEGLTEFSVEAGTDMNIVTLFTDLNSGREFRSRPFKFVSDSVNDWFGKPIVVNSEKLKCGNDTAFSLVNSSGIIPFAPADYSIIVPVIDNGLSSVNIELHKDDDIILKSTVQNLSRSTYSFTSCNNKIIFSKNNNPGNSGYLVVDDFSSKLTEGNYTLKLYPEGEENSVVSYDLQVRWISKPNSLAEPEKSLEYLSIIENPDSISKLKKASTEKLPDLLLEYWKKYDPTPRSAFNELMNEFYLRVDYAEMNFRALSGNNGARSDRGKVYIKYGSPDSTERFTDGYGRMMETWKYVQPERTFVFIDKRGNGNFTVVNGK